MNTSDLLEQLLRGGQGAMSQRGGGGAQGGLGDLGGLLGGLLGGGGGGGMGGGAGAGAGGMGGLGGLLGGLLGGGSPMGGQSQGRSGGGSNYAALASLGMMAFQAYQAWQRSQAAQQQQQAPQQAMRTVDMLAGPEIEEHSHAILRALIAAAKADGRFDDAEKQMINAEIARHTDDPQLQQWLDDEVAKPLDAAEVAQSANDPGMAAEMYLASVMLVNDQADAERNYLDELAAALGIDPDLQVHLEQQARGGAA